MPKYKKSKENKNYYIYSYTIIPKDTGTNNDASNCRNAIANYLKSVTSISVDETLWIIVGDTLLLNEIIATTNSPLKIHNSKYKNFMFERLLKSYNSKFYGVTGLEDYYDKLD